MSWHGTPGLVPVDPGGTQVNPTMIWNQVYSYYPNGKVYQSPQGAFTYDDRGLPKTRQAYYGTHTYDAYDALGRNTHFTYIDGHTRTQAYDNEGRLTQRCYECPSAPGGAVTHCYGATYDAVGNPKTLTDPYGTDFITYDSLDRVTSVARDSVGNVVETYAYNAMGALSHNATTDLDAKRPAPSGGGNVDSAVPNTYNGASIALDGEGRITSLAGTALGYDTKGSLNSFAGQLLHRDVLKRITENDANLNVYIYDGANRTGIWYPVNHAWRWSEYWYFDGVDHPLEHESATRDSSAHSRGGGPC